ncbi:MAG TPA: hypothetical protein VNM90_27015 [Haliangium sp.]|nr:hypothetical protein [Haliangium sp.]
MSMSRSGFQSPNVQRREDSAQTQDQQRVAPGKTTLTSGLSSGRAAVQRKAASGGASAGAPARSAWDQTMDPWMDAAHRGGAAIQMKEEPGAQPAAQGGQPGQAQVPGRVVTREEVHANPQAYGIPAGGNPDDWFNEYIAHTVAYMQPEQFDPNALDPAAPDYQQRLATIERHRAQMEAWGYNPDSLTFLNDSRSGDTETGLQAVRLDPRDPDGGLGSIVGFRGTEPVATHQSSLTNPTGLLDDVATDLGRDIGSTQYGPNQERIRALIAGGTGPMTLTGHSLGGALAQHAAADSTDLGIANVVGFQAPGIDRSSAQAFDAANADGHMSVRFHEHNNDVVHRAGEQKLGGTHFSYTDTNDPSFVSAHTGYFMYDGVNGQGQQVSTVGPGSTAAVSNTDPITNRLGWEGGRRLLGGAANIAASPFQGAFALGQGLGQAGVNAGRGLWDSGSSLVGGVADGAVSLGTGIADGTSQILDGNVLSGLGTMAGGAGRAIGDVAGGVWDGATGLVGTAGRAVGDTAGAVWNGVSTAGSQLVDGVGTVAHGVGNLAEWGWNNTLGRLIR